MFFSWLDLLSYTLSARSGDWLGYLLHSFPRGKVEIHRYVFTLKKRLINSMGTFVVTRNTPSAKQSFWHSTGCYVGEDDDWNTHLPFSIPLYDAIRPTKDCSYSLAVFGFAPLGTTSVQTQLPLLQWQQHSGRVSDGKNIGAKDLCPRVIDRPTDQYDKLSYIMLCKRVGVCNHNCHFSHF